MAVETAPVKLYQSGTTLEDRYRLAMYKDLLLSLGIKGKNVMDCGCRQGLWAGWFLQQGARVTAVDINLCDLQVCKREHPAARCVHTDATDMSLGESYDLIMCKDVLEHVEDDTRLMANLANHLAPGGKLVIGTQNYQSLIHLVDGTYSLLVGRVWKGYDPTHVHFYSRGRLARMFRDAGLTPRQCLSTWHSPYFSVTQRMFGHALEWDIFHLPDKLRLNGIFPFDRTGFNIVMVGEAEQ